MFGYVKNILRKWVETPNEDQTAPTVSAPPAPTRRTGMAPHPEATPAANTRGHHNGRGVELPLQPILSGLPLELQPRLTQQDAGTLTITVPLEKILAQLSRGIVKISFGELRQAAPAFFAPGADRDSVLVPLPMGEILSRLNPALITRRRVQRQVEVPADISSPFDPRSQGLIFSIGPTRPESAPTPDPTPPRANRHRLRQRRLHCPPAAELPSRPPRRHRRRPRHRHLSLPPR